MRYRVFGVDPASGREVAISVDAAGPGDAERIARDRGIEVGEILPEGALLGAGVPPPRPAPPPARTIPVPGGPVLAAPAVPSASALAIVSLVLGILGFLCFGFLLGPAAIVCGILALREVHASNGLKTGKGMAISGIVLGALAFLVSLAFLAFFITHVPREPLPPVPAPPPQVL